MKLYSQTRTEKTRMQDYYWSVTSSIRLEIRVQMLLNETNMCIFNNLPEAVHVDRWSWLVFSLRIMHEANLSTHVQSMKSCTSFDKWPATIKPCYWQQQQQPFNGRLSGTTRVGQYQKKHSPDHTHPGQRTSFITFSICNGPWHPLYSAYVFDSPLEQPLYRSSLVIPLVLNPQLHTACIPSPNHHHLFAAHAHTNAACSAAISMLCHLHLVSLSAPYLGVCLLA